MPMPSLNKTHRSKSADRQEPSMHRKFWTWTHQKPNTASFGLDSKKEVSSRREVLEPSYFYNLKDNKSVWLPGKVIEESRISLGRAVHRHANQLRPRLPIEFNFENDQTKNPAKPGPSPLRHANAEPQEDAQKQIRRSSRTKHAPQILDLDPSKAKYGLIRA
ncbi:hypothetical protein niasHT_009166 [Heterodera trifolii]|uniref:Uncharacterized protein n=1 Tax=Heterodera trifolii TaxID=157864 RepID=A0ABD2MFQ0_9BILA